MTSLVTRRSGSCIVDTITSRSSEPPHQYRHLHPQSHHLVRTAHCCNVGTRETQRSSSRFASSSLKSILHSFSTAFRVDCISLRLSVFFLSLAPTGKHHKASPDLPQLLLQPLLACGPKHIPFAGPSPSPLDH